MKPYLSNPFTEAYVSHTVSEHHFVQYFSPVLVVPSVAIFQAGNVVVRGTQGSGKSMLLRLLDPEIRIAYFEVDPGEKSADTRYPVPPELRKFISSRVDLNKSGLLDIANTLPDKATSDDVSDLVKSFADFFNYWLLRGLLLSVSKIHKHSAAFEDLVHSEKWDAFAVSLAQQDCWFGALSAVEDWTSLNQVIRDRVVSYRAWANGNASIPENIQKSRTMIGEPLSRAARILKESGVISEDTNVFVTIDQIEALWMQGDNKRALGEHLRWEIHEVLGKRDDRVSYRIGVRRHDWGKGGSLAMRDGRELEEERDFQKIDIDDLLRRGENAKGWAFRQLAKDVFRRRVKTAFASIKQPPKELEKLERFFGPSPNPQELVAAAIKHPDPTGEKLLKLDSSWPENWRSAILRCYRKEIPGLPQLPSKGYLHDPLNALLLAAWGLQTGGKGKSENNARRRLQEPPESPEEAPWNNEKQYWRKERYPQAVLQLISRHQQKMLWWGEAKVLSLCGSNILRFITICRETWDYWQRLTDDPLQVADAKKAIVPSDIQSRAIAEASRKVYEALKRQPGQPAGDVRIRFLDQVASWLRIQLLEDKSMSNPGKNGFSLRLSDLKEHTGLRQLIEEAVGWGDLYEKEHTSKIKTERSREPRRKYYLNPALSPFYELPEAHTKEPVYASIHDILKLAADARAVPITQSTNVDEGGVVENQLTLFLEA